MDSKQYILKHPSFYLMLFALLLVSCAKDERLLPENGPEVAVRFSLQATPMEGEGSSTRSTDILTVDDSAIENLWIFQFAGGTFQKKLYLESGNWNDVEVDLADAGTSDLYFVANVGSSAFDANYVPDSVGALSLASTLESSCLYPGTSKKLIPMRGCVKGVSPSSSLSMQVQLFRLLARIDFTYSVAAAFVSSSGFAINRIKLHNVNSKIPVDSVKTALYPASASLQTIDFSYEVVSGTSRTLTFYVPDNRRGTGSNTAMTSSRLKTGVTGATYIEMLGTYTNGDEYAILLYPGGDAFNDYNIRANTHYRYNMNVTGISSLDGRVRKTKEYPSNCYILAPGKSIGIPVSRANMSALGTQLADVTSGWTASIYWQTAAGLVSVNDADKSGGYFTVTAPSSTATGNAVVVVKNGSNDIVWSWHIWVTAYNPATENETNNGFVWMSRNLGATAVANGSSTTFATCGGLMYQWGRKDPFPGSDGTTNATPWKSLPIYDASGTLLTNASASLAWPATPTPVATPSYATTGDVVKYATLGATVNTQIPYASQLVSSVKYPLLYLINWAGSTATAAAAATAVGGQSAWGGLYGEGKSVYDPCPVGWRVPSYYKTSATLASPWSTWVTTQTFTTSAFAALRWDVAGVFGTYYYPAAGSRSNSNGALSGAGASGYCRGASPLGTAGYSLYFYSGAVLPSASSSRATGGGVRCVQE